MWERKGKGREKEQYQAYDEMNTGLVGFILWALLLRRGGEASIPQYFRILLPRVLLLDNNISY